MIWLELANTSLCKGRFGACNKRIAQSDPLANEFNTYERTLEVCAAISAMFVVIWTDLSESYLVMVKV